LKISVNTKTRSTPLCAALCLTILGALPGAAAGVTDPSNDFIPTFVGPHNGDLDVLSANVTVNGSNLDFTATLNGTVGNTPGEQYVFGLNRGQGTAKFDNINEPNVLFDSTVVVKTSGPSVVNDLIAGTTTTLGDVTLSGSMISAVVPLSELPSEGFDPAGYQFNLWPETTPDNPANTNISDFAPNNAVSAVSVAPEPGTLSLLSIGALAGFAAIRRRNKLRSTDI